MAVVRGDDFTEHRRLKTDQPFTPAHNSYAPGNTCLPSWALTALAEETLRIVRGHDIRLCSTVSLLPLRTFSRSRPIKRRLGLGDGFYSIFYDFSNPSPNTRLVLVAFSRYGLPNKPSLSVLGFNSNQSMVDSISISVGEAILRAKARSLALGSLCCCL